MLGDIEPEAGRALRDLSDQGVSIVLVNSDTPEVGRICCIQAENYLLGRIMGEILLGRTPRGGPILVCAGEKSTPANADSTRGLNDYLEEHDANREIYALHYGNDMDRLYRRLVERFEKEDKSSYANIKNSIKTKLKTFFKSKTKRTPVIVPIVIEVE